MKESFVVIAEPRSDAGKGASRRLRRTGMVPAIVYGARKDPEMVQLVHSDLLQHLDREAFYSHILNLKVGGGSQQVILKDLQRHPAKPFILHADFQRVSAGEKFKTNVPLHFLNEEKSPGFKQGGIVTHNLTDVEVTCLPKDLPEFIEIDMSELDVGDIVHLSDIKLPEGVEIPALLAGDEYNVPVTTIHSKSADEDEGEAEAVEEEIEREGE